MTAQAPRRQSPLQLLDLPIDVLELILNQVTYPNDLAALALTHSALHTLATPRIYSRFQVVWPESYSSSDTFAGVDALTYGLSTLASTGGAILARSHCHDQPHGQEKRPGNQRTPLRRTHNLAQHVRRFSIANGPLECLEEYSVSYDYGKLLGTLTALALAQMPKLETFVWDMPTGVLREIWVALGSLGELDDCRLHTVMVRCPDSGMINDGDESLAKTSNAVNFDRDPLRKRSRRPKKPTNYMDLSYLHIESPSFSTLPPMRSITVLEMDEPAYLQELSSAIAISVDTLRELRLGLGSLYYGNDWATADRTEVNGKKSIDTRLGFLSNGGVLGLVMKGIYDCRPSSGPNTSQRPVDTSGTLSAVEESIGPLAVQLTTRDTDNHSHVSAEGVSAAGDEDIRLNAEQKKLHDCQRHKQVDLSESGGQSAETQPHKTMLRLETLELERVTLRTTVLRHSIQWEVLTSLTLLNCGSDDRLWKILTRLYGDLHGMPPSTTKEYRLNLRKIHTNKVSFAFLTFLKDSLAPNSLEQLFLQDTNPPTSKVTVEEIYRGPLRNHCKSLKKLMIDAAYSRDGSETSGVDMTKGTEWALSRKALSFILSGKMPDLRELAMVIDIKDWHFLLQGLPRTPHLRVLYLPYIMDPDKNGPSLASEFGNHVIDVATLRPEMKLAYLAIWQNCFEILENNGKLLAINCPVRDDAESGTIAVGGSDEDAQGSENEAGEDVHDAEEEKDESSTYTTSESCLSSDEYENARFVSRKDKIRAKRLKLKLRQIPFDDKITIFKARHGKL